MSKESKQQAEQEELDAAEQSRRMEASAALAEQEAANYQNAHRKIEPTKAETGEQQQGDNPPKE